MPSVSTNLSLTMVTYESSPGIKLARPKNTYASLPPYTNEQGGQKAQNTTSVYHEGAENCVEEMGKITNWLVPVTSQWSILPESDTLPVLFE